MSTNQKEGFNTGNADKKSLPSQTLTQIYQEVLHKYYKDTTRLLIDTKQAEALMNKVLNIWLTQKRQEFSNAMKQCDERKKIAVQFNHPQKADTENTLYGIYYNQRSVIDELLEELLLQEINKQ